VSSLSLSFQPSQLSSPSAAGVGCKSSRATACASGCGTVTSHSLYNEPLFLHTSPYDHIATSFNSCRIRSHDSFNCIFALMRRSPTGTHDRCKRGLPSRRVGCRAHVAAGADPSFSSCSGLRLNPLQLQSCGDATRVASAIAILPSLSLPPPPPRPHFRQAHEDVHIASSTAGGVASALAATIPRLQGHVTISSPATPRSLVIRSPRASRAVAHPPLPAGDTHRRRSMHWQQHQ
jgi:hypothetical protein